MQNSNSHASSNAHHPTHAGTHLRMLMPYSNKAANAWVQRKLEICRVLGPLHREMGEGGIGAGIKGENEACVGLSEKEIGRRT